ncbi:hypothetical protein M3Y95_00265200 [Aphelenchoides besseyi]|nr:hypothetical protein M3Y95_00265200 [Aphelenchoides besseyi]
METPTVYSMSVASDSSRVIDRWQIGGIFSRGRNTTVMDQHSSQNREQTDEQPWYRTVNVEPTVFLFSVAFGLLIPVTSLFLFYARCVEIFAGRSPDGHYTDIENATHFCMQISQRNNTKAMDVVEEDVANIRIYMSIGNTFVVCIMAPVFGAWADKNGRRIPLIFALIGSVLYTSLQTSAVVLYDRINVFYFFFAAEVVSGLFGGLSTLFALSSSIVTDDARADKSLLPSSVPLRVAVACGFQQIGLLIGTTVTSIVESVEYLTPEDKIHGYILIFLIATSVMIVALIYSLGFVHDNYQTILEYNAENSLVLGLPASDRPQSKGWINSIVEVMTGIFRVASARRQGWKRLCLWICVISIFTEFIAFDVQITCLYVKRPPFEWSDLQFSNYILFRSVASTIGMLSIPFLIRRTSWIGKESIMVLMGILAGAFGNGIFAFAKTTQQLLTTIPLAFFSGAISPGYRTLLPKLVKQEETARAFSMFSLVTVLSPLLSTLTLNNIYASTLNSWPGFVFFIECALFLCALFGQSLVHFLLRPFWQQDSESEDTDVLLPNAFEDENEDVNAHVVDHDSTQSASTHALNSEDDNVN